MASKLTAPRCSHAKTCFARNFRFTKRRERVLQLGQRHGFDILFHACFPQLTDEKAVRRVFVRQERGIALVGKVKSVRDWERFQ